MRSVYQRTTGAVLAPMSAFLLLQGIETVALRVERHVENARKVAEFLHRDPRIEWVNYAGFPQSPYYDLAKKYLNGAPPSLLTFGVVGGYEAAKAFYDRLGLVKRLVNIGDVKSLACHPASTTHRQMTPDEAKRRRDARDDPALRRHRARRRHHRRPRPGAGGGRRASSCCGRSSDDRARRTLAQGGRAGPTGGRAPADDRPRQQHAGRGALRHRAAIRGPAGRGGRRAQIELRLYALPSVRRAPEARALMNVRYESVAALADAGLDGLIVTGLEPRAADLRDEDYWPALARLVDWTSDAGLPTVWSCLAAHAAVLRLDGVRRRPLASKLSGVFASKAVSDDPLVAGAASPMLTPHSRLNDLAPDELVRAGYEVLTHSAAAGVDAFARRGRSPALFLQGHPEYDADTLGARIPARRRPLPGWPPRPAPAPADRLLRRRNRSAPGRADRRLVRRARPGAGAALRRRRGLRRAAAHLRPAAVRLYRNWLAEVARADAGTAIGATAVWSVRPHSDPSSLAGVARSAG